MTSRKNVFDIISHERDHQNNTANRVVGKETFPLFDWLNFIDAHLLQARRAESVLEATEEIRNLAACAVAALEEYGARVRTPELDGVDESQMTLSELMNPRPLTNISYTAPTAQSRGKKGPADRRAEKKRLKDDEDDDEDDLYGIGKFNSGDGDDDDDDDADASS